MSIVIQFFPLVKKDRTGSLSDPQIADKSVRRSCGTIGEGGFISLRIEIPKLTLTILPNKDLEKYPLKMQKSFFKQNGGTDTHFGEMRPDKRSFKRSSRYAKARDEVIKIVDARRALLNEEEQKHFAKRVLQLKKSPGGSL